MSTGAIPTVSQPPKRKNPFNHTDTSVAKRPRNNVGGKRAASTASLTQPSHPSRLKSKNNDRSNAPSPSPTANTTSLNALKSRARSLRRLLASPASTALPATVRQEHERELSNLESDIAELSAEKARSKMIGRYHKVRFFERRKADRQVRKLTRAVRQGGAEGSDDGSNAEAQERRLHDAEVDLKYTLYYPLEVAYVSLFAADQVTKEATGKAKHTVEDVNAEDRHHSDRQDGPVEDESPPEAEKHASPDVDASSLPSSRPRMWQIIADLMAKETSESDLQALRDGKLAHLYADVSTADGPKKSIPKNQVSSHKKASRDSSKANRFKPARAPPQPAAPLNSKPSTVAAQPALTDSAGNRLNRRERRKNLAATNVHRMAVGARDEGADGSDSETGGGFFE